MLCFLSKTILHGRRRPIKIEAFTSPNLLYIFPFSTASNQQPFTVSYLIKTCGLSPESAFSASKHVSFRTPNHPDSVIALLKSHGFSEPQIATIIGKMPCMLSSKVEKTLLPKIMFFKSKGISSSDLTKLLSRNPAILRISLEKRIIPSFNFLSNLFRSDNDALHVLNLWPRILSYDVDSYFLPNCNVLRQNGVPELNIVKGFRRFPSTLSTSPIVFKEHIEKVKNMGFNPESLKFVLAVRVFGSMSKSTWERKFDVFKRCGWSEEEVLDAFSIRPLAMTTSENKIKAVMDFLVNVMGFSASSVVKQPHLLDLSMEKRLVPRGLFLKDLMSKGLLEKELVLSMFEISEEKFLKRFVYCYEGEEGSELLKLYNENLKLAAEGKLKTERL